MALNPHSNLKVDLRLAKEQLRSHTLHPLFTQTLGWQPIAAGHQKPIRCLQQPCTPIAYRNQVTVWQVLLTKDFQLTSETREQLYCELAQHSVYREDSPDSPLVIFIDSAKTRSLWCQSLQASALYVVGQPVTLWEFRLRRLAQSHQGLFPAAQMNQYKTFEQLLNGLYEGISGISNSADRQGYAALTLQRLVFIQSMQQKGWLNGDTWYLQKRFGEALQQRSHFFKACLQLLYQSFALPEAERPLALTQNAGAMPFLGHLFSAHSLERRYPTVDITNQPFEEVLGWLSEQTSADALNPWMSGELGYLLEHYWAQQAQPPSDYVGTPALARGLSDRALDSLLLRRINKSFSPTSSFNDVLFNATPVICRRLIQEILPNLRILDPACGSGSVLAAINQRLVEIFSILTGYIQQNQDTQLKIWKSGLIEQSKEQADVELSEKAERNLLLSIQKRVFKNSLYGVDILAGAVETAHFQLLLHGVALAEDLPTQNYQEVPNPQAIEPLPDLSFNIMPGNSLIGLIDVDEERFDQVNSAGALSVLQGNLLQPLAADGYQTILSGKNLALEYYKSRNQLLAKARDIPDYARASLLREEITQLDAKAQTKLNTLLLNHMSEQLGIQYKAMQLTDRPERRVLTLEDIDVLQPFHWGYHFNTIMQQGGFDGIVCVPPWGAFKPTAEEFFQRFQDLAEAKGMNAKALKTSKQALAKGDPEIAEAWLFYQEQYAYVADYYYRSEQYAHQNPMANGKAIRNQLARERLFVERCFYLLNDGGVGAIALPEKLSESERAKTLQDFFFKNTDYSEFKIELADKQPIELEGMIWKM